MTSEEVGSACIAAAREQVDSSQLWTLLTDRAQELGTEMEPRDVALLLNGLSRTRQLNFFPNILKNLAPSIEEKISYYSSIQIAMILSAVSKASGSNLTPSLLGKLVTEVKNRVHEFASPVELSMLMNALVKLNVTDSILYRRFSSFIQSRMKNGNFHVREISIIAHAFSIANIRDISLFEKLFEKSLITINEATPIEIARIVAAYNRISLCQYSDQFVENFNGNEKFKYLSPSDLVATVYSFCAISDETTSGRMGDIHASLKSAFVASFSLLTLCDIASILTSFTRWKIPFKLDEKLVVLNKLRQVKTISVDYDTACSIIGSLGCWRTTESMMDDEISSLECIKKFLPSFFSGIAIRNDDWPAVARATVAIPHSQTLVHAIQKKLLNGNQNIDRTSRGILVEYFSKNLGPDHDLVLALASDRY